MIGLMVSRDIPVEAVALLVADSISESLEGQAKPIVWACSSFSVQLTN